MLITTWFYDPHRSTRDVDLLGYGDPAPEPMLAVFKEICAIKENDGILFDVEALRIDLIREQLEYGASACVRLRGWPARGLRSSSMSVLATRSNQGSRKSACR